jgi:hypothetical protein
MWGLHAYTRQRVDCRRLDLRRQRLQSLKEQQYIGHLPDQRKRCQLLQSLESVLLRKSCGGVAQDAEGGGSV